MFNTIKVCNILWTLNEEIFVRWTNAILIWINLLPRGLASNAFGLVMSTFCDLWFILFSISLGRKKDVTIMAQAGLGWLRSGWHHKTLNTWKLWLGLEKETFSVLFRFKFPIDNNRHRCYTALKFSPPVTQGKHRVKRIPYSWMRKRLSLALRCWKLAGKISYRPFCTASAFGCPDFYASFGTF